jgi:hypothetical protein
MVSTATIITPRDTPTEMAAARLRPAFGFFFCRLFFLG